MGLAPGGKIKQDIAKAPYGLEAWDISTYSRCCVHLLNSDAFQRVTGRLPPTQPITPAQYRDQGIPWFDYYHEGPRLPGAVALSSIDSLAS